MTEQAASVTVICAHCLRETADTYRCPECAQAVICQRCAAEVGLLGPAAMLQARTPVRPQEPEHA